MQFFLEELASLLPVISAALRFLAKLSDGQHFPCEIWIGSGVLYWIVFLLIPPTFF